MGFLAPAVPWLIKGASAIGGLFAGKGAQNAAQQRSPEEQQALQGAQQAGANLTSTGMGLTGAGLPAAQQATGYWSTLLSGNRPQMNLATAGPRASITDQYRGAQRGLERSGVRGAVKDLATGEMGRQEAGQIAGLTTGIQPAAASSLGQLGTQLTGQGVNALSGVGGLYSNLLGQGAGNRYYARQQGQDFGTSMGSLIFDVLNGTVGKKFGQSGGNPAPNIPYGATQGPAWLGAPQGPF